MLTKTISTVCTLIVSLVAVSCSPIVAEYTYRGTSTNSTRGDKQIHELKFKEYEDGTISGFITNLSEKFQYEFLKRSYPFEEIKIKGHIHGSEVEFQYASAQELDFYLCSHNESGDRFESFQGEISENRHTMRGQWNRKTNRTFASYHEPSPFCDTFCNHWVFSKRERCEKGFFSFQLISEINHKTEKNLPDSFFPANAAARSGSITVK